MGINIPDFSDIQQSVATVLTNTYGSQLNLDPSTPTGQQAYNLAVSFQSQYQILQEAESSASVFSAQGNRLNDLAALTNIYRTTGSKTICKGCILTGTNGTIIPAGSKAKTTNDIIFYSANDVTIVGTTATVSFVSEDVGSFDVEVGDLNTIVDVVSGWTAITNPNVGVEGSNDQSDKQFRQAIINQQQNVGKGYVGSIKANIEGVDGVKQAYVYMNAAPTTSPPPYSVPRNGVLCVIHYIDETLNAQIAETIFTTLPCIKSYSSTAGGTAITENVTYSSGTQTEAINWLKAEEVPVNFVITLTVNTSFTESEQTAVETAIADFIEDNAQILQPLVYTQILAAAVNAAPDARIEDFFMGTVATPGSADRVDITGAFYQVFVLGTISISYAS